ncbi:hypothetical protein BKX95_11985 [Streptococcus iniae]|nr:hypothetical protein BKX95_11985 [Streptococcus iniae]
MKNISEQNSEFEEEGCIFLDASQSENPNQELFNAILSQNQNLTEEEIQQLKVDVNNFLEQREEALNIKEYKNENSNN